MLEVPIQQPFRTHCWYCYKLATFSCYANCIHKWMHWTTKSFHVTWFLLRYNFLFERAANDL